MNYLFALSSGAAKVSTYNIFPVGIAYVSAYMKFHNHCVFTANLEFENNNLSVVMERLLKNNSIDVLCISGLSRDYPRLKKMIDITRVLNSHIIIVVGGGIVSGDSSSAMTALDADIGVIGQGEVTMHELATALNNGSSLDVVHGLIFKQDGRYVITPVRKDITNLDNFPFPDYDGFLFSKYLEQINHQAVYVTASRSCPFSCTFCFHPSGTKYRQRSLDNLFLEIDLLITGYGAKSIVVGDELFATSKNRVLEFCDRMSSFNVPWSVQLRVCDVDRDLLRTMRNSGCNALSYGIESADNNVLKSMRKKITIEQTAQALKWTHEADIEIQGGFIFGDIAETSKSVESTMKWYDDHAHYNLDLNMIQIFPGTPLYDYACTHGIITDRCQFLRDGCPQINVSRLSDKEYISLSSNLYERNMLAKYEPTAYSVSFINNAGECTIDAICNKCDATFSLQTDMLHVTQTRCKKCHQRYYVDPMRCLRDKKPLPNNAFANEPWIAIWGAGELCIKLLDMYEALHNDRFIVVDSSKSRQGYFIRGKEIFSPKQAVEKKVQSIIVTVVRRKDEILKQISDLNLIADIYIPAFTITSNTKATFGLEHSRIVHDC